MLWDALKQRGALHTTQRVDSAGNCMRNIMQPFRIRIHNYQRYALSSWSGLWITLEHVFVFIWTTQSHQPVNINYMTLHFQIECIAYGEQIPKSGDLWPVTSPQFSPSHYLLTPVPSESQVKFLCPWNISGTSRQQQCCSILMNWSRWGTIVLKPTTTKKSL